MEISVEHERGSSAWQGWRDSSSWMLASREEALKLAPACGARTVYKRGWWRGEGASEEDEDGSLLEEKQ